ncbi:MAG: adenylate/guanylate cyclase domain-containing protein [Deltaproteobacteria bacterium]|nr:adenylate/guanylate cyclase domain-containing protein [Deltaproteobacteria bacterium]MBI3389636.1 adenylate/guanylate cyclase domain-containing protein [Deltaproteobacteria bacterium]
MVQSPSPTRFDRLVDRYADMTTWPTAKKTAFAMATALAFHVVVPTMTLLAFTWWAPGLVDVPRVAGFFAVWVLVIAVILGVSLVVARKGREGRWTFYLLIFAYGTFVIVVLWLFGTATSPWLSILPLVILFVPLYFDRRAGGVAFAFAFAMLTALSVLELSELMPLAPIMRGRTLEALRMPGWYIGVYTFVFSVLGYVSLLVQLSVSVRERQQRHLEATNLALSQTSNELARANEMISRYVASQLADKIRSGHYEDVERHERRKLTLFFSDIKDFTVIAERLEPEDLSALLNEYLSEMSAIANRHGGTIDKFVGDAIMILFGAPVATTDGDQAARAVRMAAEMQERLVALRQKWHRDGVEHDVEVRMGINTGQATIGNFGSTDRMDYTAIGRQVNLAARLQAHCVPSRILLSHSTYMLVSDEIACAPKGEIQVKGFEHPVSVYEVIPGPASEGLDGQANA